MKRAPTALVALPPSHVNGFEVQEVGMLDLSADGRMMMGDPFRDFVKKGNPFIQLPVGKWPIMATIAVSGGERVVECISLVFDRELLGVRRRWQSRLIDRGGCVALPADILSSCLQDSDEATHWECMTGHAAIVAKQDFETGMPHSMPDMGWFEMLFENGKPGSWFDIVDRAQEAGGGGVVVLPLPVNHKSLLVFPCHGQLRAWMERAMLPGDGAEALGELEPLEQEVIMRAEPLVALHIQSARVA